MFPHQFSCDIAPVLRQSGISAAFLAVYGLRNADNDAAFQLLKEQVEQRRLGEISRESLKSDAMLAGFRRLHEVIGVSNKRNIAAPESLQDFLLRTGHLPHINLLVDIYNLISAQTSLSLGAHDLRKITGGVHLRITDGSEHFIPLGADEAKVVRAGEYAYIDDAGDILCRLEVRQAEKTKITMDTTDAFFIVQGNAATTADYIRAATRQLIELLLRFCGGREEVLLMP